MISDSTTSRPNVEASAWRRAVTKYQRSNLRISLWQMANSFVPFLILWVLMYRSLEVSYLLTLLLAIPAAGFTLRIFIILHDCGHGSFFKSKRASDIVGIIAGILTFTPYYHWRHNHAKHHATSGDLDRRGVGDVWTMTVKEYQAASFGERFKYRFYRNPFVLFVFGPVISFVILQRLPFEGENLRPRERNSVYWTDLALLGIVIVASLTIGFWQYVLVQLPIIWIAASVGVWLFYVQHQYEGVYWERHEDWDYATAAIFGSSFYKLPKVLQWFTGNIGFHHIHHLSPRIPNYHLESCHDEAPIFQEVEPVTLQNSYKSLAFRLWDEEGQRLVGAKGYRQIKQSD